MEFLSSGHIYSCDFKGLNTEAKFIHEFLSSFQDRIGYCPVPVWEKISANFTLRERTDFLANEIAASLECSTYSDRHKLRAAEIYVLVAMNADLDAQDKADLHKLSVLLLQQAAQKFPDMIGQHPSADMREIAPHLAHMLHHNISWRSSTLNDLPAPGMHGG